jgi:hypothetical protein
LSGDKKTKAETWEARSCQCCFNHRRFETPKKGPGADLLLRVAGEGPASGALPGPGIWNNAASCTSAATARVRHPCSRLESVEIVPGRVAARAPDSGKREKSSLAVSCKSCPRGPKRTTSCQRQRI